MANIEEIMIETLLTPTASTASCMISIHPSNVAYEKMERNSFKMYFSKVGKSCVEFVHFTHKIVCLFRETWSKKNKKAFIHILAISLCG